MSLNVNPHGFVNFPFLMHISLFFEKKTAENVCVVELTSSNSVHSLWEVKTQSRGAPAQILIYFRKS